MRKQSLKKPLCVCCMTNRTYMSNGLFCINCKRFIHHKLNLSMSFVSAVIRNVDIPSRKRNTDKCTLCGVKAYISYRHIETKKKYFLCKSHHERWLSIGCDMAEFVNLISR